MKRVMHFKSADGTLHPNTDRCVAPFRIMTRVGDYFEVHENDCTGGNLSGMASLYSRTLGRRFHFRTLAGAHGKKVHRVTLVSLDLGSSNPGILRVPKKVPS